MKAARKAKETRVTRVKAETERDIITDSESVIEVGVGSGSLGSKIRWGQIFMVQATHGVYFFLLDRGRQRPVGVDIRVRRDFIFLHFEWCPYLQCSGGPSDTAVRIVSSIFSTRGDVRGN